MEILTQQVGHGIWLILLLSLPAVLLAAGIGLIVGILQAVTQVQEQTIAAAPKITLVFLLVIFGGPLMLDILKDFTTESVHLGMEEIPKSEAMVLPPKPRLAYGEANSRLDFFKEVRRFATPSKIKPMMEQGSPNMGALGSGGSVQVKSAQVQPKPGVGEEVYIKRRAEGTLPKPPKP